MSLILKVQLGHSGRALRRRKSLAMTAGLRPCILQLHGHYGMPSCVRNGQLLPGLMTSRVTVRSSSSKPEPNSTSDWAQEFEELLKLVNLLPPSVRSSLEAHPNLTELLEVVMDLGRPPLARFPGGDARLCEELVTAEDLEYAVAQVGSFGADNRAGIDRTLHRISCMRNRTGKIIGLTCRAGRAVPGSAAMVEDIVMSGASILLLGRPGVGKTTAIREVSRMLAEDLAKRVVIVDTSNEIGGDGDIPHPGIGRARRMQVGDPNLQHRVMIEGVENHMPEVIVIDEIGTLEECEASRTIAQRGVQLVATAHGNELENVVKNPSLAELIGGVQSVTLGDEEAKRRGVQKSVLERAAPPTFDVAIEMMERTKWRVHLDVAQAVDRLLAGSDPGGQVRERAADGSILKYNYSPTHAGPGAAIKGERDVRMRERTPVLRPVKAAQPQEGEGREGAAAPTSYAFVRPAVVSEEDETTRALRRGGGQQCSAESAVLRIYPYQLDPDKLREVMVAMGLLSKVYITRSVSQADAVVAVRSKIKQNASLKMAAKEAGVPIYAVKTSGAPNLVRAFRTLLGIEASAGGTFLGDGGGDGTAQLTQGSVDGLDNLDSDTVTAGKDEGGPPASALNPAAALHEASLAVENIVLPLQQPVELLPRVEAVRKMQIEMLDRYLLSYEVVGEGYDARLRVLPKNWQQRGSSNGGGNGGSGRGNGNGNVSLSLQELERAVFSRDVEAAES